MFSSHVGFMKILKSEYFCGTKFSGIHMHKYCGLTALKYNALCSIVLKIRKIYVLIEKHKSFMGDKICFTSLLVTRSLIPWTSEIEQLQNATAGLVDKEAKNI